MVVVLVISIISLLYLTVKLDKKLREKIKSKEITQRKFAEEIEKINYSSAEKSFIVHESQYEYNLNIIKTSTDISIVLSKFEYLKSFLSYIQMTAREYPNYDYSPLLIRIKGTLADKEEYINLTILRMVSQADIETVGLTTARKRGKYKTIYRHCENVKNRLSEANIKTYTDLVMQRLDIDLLSLPEYALLLTRLNCSRKDDAIPAEYYSDEYPTFTAAVSAMIKAGYLTITDDKSRYILTDSGLKQTGWL